MKIIGWFLIASSLYFVVRVIGWIILAPSGPDAFDLESQDNTTKLSLAIIASDPKLSTGEKLEQADNVIDAYCASRACTSDKKRDLYSIMVAK